MCHCKYWGKNIANVERIKQWVPKKKRNTIERNSSLFGIDWFILFNLWEIPINAFCRILDVLEVKKSVQTEKYFYDLKSKFTKVFADGLGYRTKAEVKFKLKDSTRPVFKPKRNIRYRSDR